MHDLFIGSYTGERTHFNLYLGENCANVAKYLYKQLGIDLYMHVCYEKISYEQFCFTTQHIGCTYSTDANCQEVALSVEEDVYDMCKAYNVIVVWNNRLPISKQLHDAHSLPFLTSDTSSFYYVFYNFKECKTIVVDGACPEFQRSLQSLEFFPGMEWEFVAEKSKNVLRACNCDVVFKDVFNNHMIPDVPTLKDRIKAFNVLFSCC